MNELLLILAIVACAAVYFMTRLDPARRARVTAALMGVPYNSAVACNIAEGTHSDTEGGITRTADDAGSTDYLLYKAGTDDDHAAVCGASDCPIGVSADAPAAGDTFTIDTLGAASRTRLCRVNEAVSAGEELFTAASGYAQNRPGSSGTYWFIGTALRSAAAGEKIEFAPTAAVKVVI